MSVVVDACVALKWVLDEPGAERARALGDAEAMIAPDFLILECANVLAVKVRRGLLTPDGARKSLEGIRTAPVRLLATTDHIAEAHAIAVELGASAYDSLYLALAIAEQTVLVTADGKFARAILSHGAYSTNLRLL